MLSPDAQDRLAQLNRGAPVPGNVPRPTRPRPAAPPAPLRGQVIRNAYGQHLLIRHELAQLWPDGAEWAVAEMARWRACDRSPPNPHPELILLGECFPGEVCFLDLETCGLGGATVFLAGLIHRHGPGLVLSQLWARHYGEEAALLGTFWEIFSECRVLVTFNGKSFDWPQIQDRSVLHRLGTAPRDGQPPGHHPHPSAGLRQLRDGKMGPPEGTRPVRPGGSWHCDLLHHSRRRWKHVLPNCRLQTLERFICGRRRSGDIAGRDIPEAYHRYVDTGQATSVKNILHHNALDLVTLVQLGVHLVDPGAGHREPIPSPGPGSAPAAGEQL
jgi:hypothetical protein